MRTGKKDRRYKIRIATAVLWVFFLCTGIYLGYDYSIKNVGFSPNQPVAFSHKKHSGDFEMKCLFCHHDAEKSSFSSIPSTKSYMICHLALKNQSELMKLVNHSFDNNIPIQYTRVNILPDFTHFNHSRHIRAQIRFPFAVTELTENFSGIPRFNFVQLSALSCDINIPISVAAKILFPLIANPLI